MIYRFGDCMFDLARQELRRADAVIRVEPQALRVLCYLFEHRDRVVSRDELIEQCWRESYVSDASLSSCLRRVRQAIGQRRETPILIETVHRRGYRFVAEVTELAEPAPATPETEALSAVEREDATEPEEPPLAPDPALRPEPAARTERRHLTVLSCALSDAERLTQQLDPDDYYDLLQSFRDTTLAVIARYEGHVAQHVDDRVLIYFGYPQAHEDDAQRAVLSGLALVEALGRVAPVGHAGDSAGLAVRVGIDSGMVIVSSGSDIAAQPSLAVGNPLTWAVRLSESVRPCTVVISEATAKLVEGYFDCKPLKDPVLAGQPESQLTYEVLGESTLQTRLDIGMARGLTPFVGREAELAVFRDRWTYVQDGMGQVVMLRGEAGIGKSRLIQVLKDQVSDEQLQPVECRCSPYHQHTALYPVIDSLQRVLQARSAASGDETLETLEALLRPYPFSLQESVPLLARLLSLPIPNERYPPLTLSPQRQRDRAFDLLATLLVAQAVEAPMVFIVEDLHWADPSTLDFLDVLIGQVPTISMLVVLTFRPAFEARWSELSWITPVTLTRLTRPQIHQMMTQVAGGKAFAAEVTEQLAEKTDGVPLFVEELVRTVLETGQFEETEASYELVGELDQLSIPATLHDSLMSRLDRLGSAKAIAQWGAILGREFTYEMIEKVVPHDEEGLQEGLERLVESELVFRRGLAMQVHYRFKHALVQEVAYQSLRPRTRQARHKRIAQVLAEQFPETVESQPELVAHHYTEAGEDEAAVDYWKRAGQRAIQRSANQEAIAHLRQALALLTRGATTPARLQQELDLQVALGSALTKIKGQSDPDVERVHARAQALCEQIGDMPQLFPVLRGLTQYHMSAGNLRIAYQLGEHLLRLAQGQSDPLFLMMAHWQMGIVLMYRGELVLAQTHQSQALAIHSTLPTPQDVIVRFGADAGSICRSDQAFVLWQMGYPDQALQYSQAAHTLAQEILHPYSQAVALVFASFLHHFRREVRAQHDQAATTITITIEEGFAFWGACGTVLHGSARVKQGEVEQGMAEMRQGIDAFQATGAKVFHPYFLGLLAAAYGEEGQSEEGLPLLDEAIAVMDTSEARFYGAELYRLKGVLLLKQVAPDASQAEACFHRALDIARHQEAKSWELRAATSLARLWRRQGKSGEARDLLVPVYNWFSEGFDTADLIDAGTLLDELAG